MAIPTLLSDRIAKYKPHMSAAECASAAMTLRSIASMGAPPRTVSVVESMVGGAQRGHLGQWAFPGRVAIAIMFTAPGMSVEDLEAAAVAVEAA